MDPNSSSTGAASSGAASTSVPLHQDVSFMRHVLDGIEGTAHRINWVKALSVLSVLGGPAGAAIGLGANVVKAGQLAAVLTEMLNSPQVSGVSVVAISAGGSEAGSAGVSTGQVAEVAA